MKRSPLRRRTPMKRTRGKPGGQPKRDKRKPSVPRDASYMGRVARLHCRVFWRLPIDTTPCGGRMHAHHAGVRPGTGIKASDYSCIPLCEWHHTEWHAVSGAFKGWTRAQRRDWSDEQIAAVQALLGVG